MHKVAGKVLAFERDLDNLDLHVRVGDELMEAVDSRAVCIEGLLVLRRPEALAHLVIMAGAQIERGGGDRMARGPEALRIRAYLVGNFDAGLEPCLVVLAALAL